MWSHWICDTVTGNRLLPVDPSAGRWRTVVNGIGDGEHTFQLRDTETALPRTTWRDLATPWARTLVTCWDDVPQYAGLVVKNKYARATGALTLSTTELRSVFTRRWPFTVTEFTPDGVKSVTGKSLRGLARQIVAWATEGGPNWGLPVVLQGDESGGESREWFHYNFVTIDAMLTEIQDTVGGPNVHLWPRWSTTGSLEWVLRLGTPGLSGPTFDWDSTADQSDLTGLDYTRDGSLQLTGVIALGNGSEQDMHVGKGLSPGGTQIPFLDASRPFKKVDDVDQLDALATAEVNAVGEATELFEFGALAPSVLPSMVLGSTLRVWIEDDEFINDGWVTGSLIGLKGDLTDNLGLEFQ